MFRRVAARLAWMTAGLRPGPKNGREVQMKRFGLIWLWVICGLTALCLAAAPARAQMRDLGTLGGNKSAANCINDQKTIVGNAETAPGSMHAFIIRDTQPMSQLFTPEENNTCGRWVNNILQIVGFDESIEGYIAFFVWEKAKYYLQIWGINSSAEGINDQGTVVGSATTAAGSMKAFLIRHYLDNADGVQSEASGDLYDLGTLGGNNSYGCGVNNLDQVVGYAQNAAGQFRAFLYTGTPGVDGKMHDLGTLGGSNSYAYGINNLGQIVGASQTTGGETHAFLYNGVPGVGGAMTDLGTLGGQWSEARGINNLGQIVGASTTASGRTHAFLYANGVMRDLGVLPGGTDSWAYSINNLGQIVGEATTAAGYRHAFLYNPPQATAPALLLLLSEWLRPLTGWGRPPSLALPPVAGPGGMEGRFRRG